MMLNDNNATHEGTGSIIAGNNRFAFELYDKLDKEGNVFFSPFSIESALSMAYEGAKGETALEMQKVLHIPKSAAIRRSAFAKINNMINSGNDKITLSSANALWVQKDYHLLPEYVKTVEEFYGGWAASLDFAGNTEGSRQTINKWVEEKTSNRIKDLIPPGGIDSSTISVLTNAIYFKGKWALEFDPENTREKDFKSPSGVIRAEMMGQAGEKARFPYAEDSGMQILELPYDGEKLSMLIILPKEDLEGLKPDADKLLQWKGMLKEQRVDVYIPKFRLDAKYMMKDTLMGMGMNAAFNNADFSGIDGTRNLRIGQVIHQAFIEVNEEGTEAAAATAVPMVFKSATNAPKTPVFMADHPFIFIIQEKETGIVLFMGRVSSPKD